MAYNDQEISNQDGRLVALYTLKWGNTIWRYTSADRDIVRTEDAGEVTYAARPVSDEGMTQGSSSQNDFTINIPDDLPIVELFRGTPPSETIWMTVRRVHYESDDAPIYWIGTVTNVKRGQIGSAQVIGRPLVASFKRTGLRLCWTKECPHFLYDSDCRVDPADYEVLAEVTAVSPSGFTVDAIGDLPDQWFQGGIISWEVNADLTLDRRMIRSQVGLDFVIFGFTDRLEVGTPVKLYPGCDRTPGTCSGKFDNLANYGGFDFMPGKTPFGTRIF